MNKAELLEAITKATKLRPTYVHRVVNAIFDPTDGVVAKQLRKGEKVTIAGFGTFERRSHKGRDVASVFTNTVVRVKARKLPGFRAGVSLRDTVNGGK